MKRKVAELVVLAFVSVFVAGSVGGAEIKNVQVAQNFWPWSGKVDIQYEVVGELPTGCGLAVTATDIDDNTTYKAMFSSLSGDTGREEGLHRVVWDLKMQEIDLHSTNVVFSVSYVSIYCVVDLSAGESASSYPVTWLLEPPSEGFNTDEYKTTKLVLRRIEPGTFKMCGAYPVTLTKPYFIGIFEVTQKQYELVTGGNPSSRKGDVMPVSYVSWNMVRGDSGTYDWPTKRAVDDNTFMGRLQARTGLNFDLPTEAQWEYACRAGTTSPYNNGGKSEDDLKQLGRYGQDSRFGDGYANVGSYQPNAWGLYDMHGNVEEWCLDWYVVSLPREGMADPEGPVAGGERIKRGGHYLCSADRCQSGIRNKYNPAVVNAFHGFRLACSEGL